MEDLAQKEAFGIALALSPDDAFKAACAVFGDDSGGALKASQTWLKDPVVIAAKLKFIEDNGRAADLPTKDEFAAEVLKMARQKSDDGQRFIYDGKDRLAAYKLAAEVMGYMPKPGSINLNQVNNDNRTQNVMYVPQPSTNDDWEERLAKQQAALTSVAAN